jgi:hypothetical protein
MDGMRPKNRRGQTMFAPYGYIAFTLEVLGLLTLKLLPSVQTRNPS